MTNLTLKVKVTSCKLVQTLSMIRSNEHKLCVKVKLQIQVNLKFEIFCKFKGQFDLEGQGRGHSFL